MSPAPDITVIIPTRNRLSLLRECLDRVQAQAAVNYEVIVVDDNSSDGTWKWLQHLNDPRVTALRQVTCQRQAAARNRGLALAGGRYVMFLDDDDLLRLDALSTLSCALDRTPQAVAAIGAREDWFTAEGYRRRDVHPRFPRIRNITDDLMAGWSAVPSQTLFRAIQSREVGGYDTTVVPCEDRDFLQKVCKLGPVAFCPQTVVTYRITPAQSRPANIHQLRETVARRAIRNMPRENRREALRTRRMVRLLDEAEEQFTDGSIVAGSKHLCRALLAARFPRISPHVALWVARRLAGRIARRYIRPHGHASSSRA